MADAGELTLDVPAELQPLLYSRRRHVPLALPLDGVSTIGHLIGSIGLPLTEIDAVLRGGQPVDLAWQPREDATVEVIARRRPQQGSRFLLDVHLGTLARRMRLLGIDTAWNNEADDDDLIAQASAAGRVLLTRDRGLLLRRAAREGAYVRGNGPDDQLEDVLDRFAPPLAPWSRCVACNALLEAVPKSAVVEQLQPGTRRSYDIFARCTRCGQLYWHGAHAARLEQIVARFS